MTGSKKHVVYVLSGIQKSLAFEWIADALSENYHVTWVLLNPGPSAMEAYLLERRHRVKRLQYRGKRDLFSVVIRLVGFFLSARPAVVHAHLFDAQLAALPAAWLAHVPKRIYTRHNSTLHHVYFRKGIFLDRLSNRLATHIISVSQATYKTLTTLESVNKKKIHAVPHGFDFSVFSTAHARVEALKTKWKISEETPRIGVISRHIEWKGVQYIIEAFRTFLYRYPTATLVLANAHGPYHNQLLSQLEDIPHERYVLIPFEEDVISLYALFDIFVHTPIDELAEAYGQTYIEALACGIPSIFTLSGIAAECIRDNEHALVVGFKNSDQILVAMEKLWLDKALRGRLANNGKAMVQSMFPVSKMITQLKEIYDG